MTWLPKPFGRRQKESFSATEISAIMAGFDPRRGRRRMILMILLIFLALIAVALFVACFGVAEYLLYTWDGLGSAIMVPVIVCFLFYPVVYVACLFWDSFLTAHSSKVVRSIGYAFGVGVIVAGIVIPYSFFLCSAWSQHSEAPNFLRNLRTAFYSQDTAMQKRAIDTFHSLHFDSKQRVIERLKLDPKLLERVEPFLWKLVAERNETRLGLFLALISSRSDPIFLTRSVRQAATLLDNNANWKDAGTAKDIYGMLKAFGSRVVPVLITEVMNPNGRLQLLFLVVKLGIKGSEDGLVKALEEHGDKQMAEDYLNSGSEVLGEGAKRWAESRGYKVMEGKGSHRVIWGSF